MKSVRELPTFAGQGCRARLVARVAGGLGREVASSMVLLHSAIAASAGLGTIDMRCLEMIAATGRGRVTPGDLTRATGLTTGSITGVIDRLESAGLVRRIRDTDDRRKVFLEPLSGAAATKLMAACLKASEAVETVASRRSTAELVAIERFLAETIAALGPVMKQIKAGTIAMVPDGFARVGASDRDHVQ